MADDVDVRTYIVNGAELFSSRIASTPAMWKLNRLCRLNSLALDVKAVRTYSFFMARPSNRGKILAEGLRIVHERGFGGASVRDIAQAAQVPLGSFTSHFASKEAFGLEILELYYGNSRTHIVETLSNEALRPLDRISAYIDHVIAVQNGADMRRGCLFGNFGAEVVDHSEALRLRLVEIFKDIRQSFADCLKAAVAAGELPEDYNCEEAACFLFAALQGAIVIAKTQRSDIPLARYKRMIFEKVLK